MAQFVKTSKTRRLATARWDVGFALLAYHQGAVVFQPGVEAFDLIAFSAGRMVLRLRAALSVLELTLRGGGANAFGPEPAT
ncbi:MAG: hypothetical protein K6T57_10140 [Thermaceae bacterium]|nr:hypothetical protein [Thermaceae bacterium]